MKKKEIPSLKGWLFQIYDDLEACKRLSRYHLTDNLTKFEVVVILLEDRRYLDHLGIDWRSVARVVVKGIFGASRGGASTIEMQFIRTATGRYERTMRRKLYEMLLAFLIGFHMEKLDILRSYLECAYFGYNLKGCSEASIRLFGKADFQLNVDESAFLAAMLVYPAPKSLDNKRWLEKVRRRARYGLALSARLENRLQQLAITYKR